MTSPEENSWLALLATVPLLVAFSLAMPVMRGPNSWMAIIASLIPFFSPILMPIRIITQTPPTWQIVLSIFIGLFTVLLLLRLAARLYHVGMLMYGKKVSIPEAMRWLRQA
jgi:ABC-2 type transport system permease protein